MRRLLTEQQVAEITQLSPSWLEKERRLAKRGQPNYSPPFSIIGRSIRYHSDELDKWLDGMKRMGLRRRA